MNYERNTPLGDRMKERYEDRWRIFMPRRTCVILRLDGKAFSSVTRSMDKPFDEGFAHGMDAAMNFLKGEIQGCKFGYTQSDEISLLLTDFETDMTEGWFNWNMQKMISVSAAYASVDLSHYLEQSVYFDCRAFVVPDPVEVANYFIWRQRDCARNSIQGLAQKHYSHKKLQGHGNSELHEMIHEAGDNWDKWPVRFKRGGTTEAIETPIFSQDWPFLRKVIPVIRGFDDLP